MRNAAACSSESLLTFLVGTVQEGSSPQSMALVAWRPHDEEDAAMQVFRMQVCCKLRTVAATSAVIFECGVGTERKGNM